MPIDRNALISQGGVTQTEGPGQSRGQLFCVWTELQGLGRHLTRSLTVAASSGSPAATSDSTVTRNRGPFVI